MRRSISLSWLLLCAACSFTPPDLSSLACPCPGSDAADGGGDADAGGGLACRDGVQNGDEPFVDSGGSCPIRVPGCDEMADPWTVALFRFSDLPSSAAMDTLGQHAGSFFSGTEPGTVATGQASSSASGCGQAWSANGSTWIEIANSPTWDTLASIDLRLQVPNAATASERLAGVLSRDATGDGQLGHFYLLVNEEQRVVARFQDDTSSVYRCSEPVAAGSWIHVGVNLGSPDAELWVNGIRATYAGSTAGPMGGEGYSCSTQVAPRDLAGNQEPWSVGATNDLSSLGTNNPIRRRLPSGGRIDELRFSNARRDFTR